VPHDVKFGILAPAYPPIDAALESARRIERLGWDFLDYADQMVSTHPYRLLTRPTPEDDPGLPSGLFIDEWFGSMEMCAAGALVTEHTPITLGVIDPLRRGAALMAQEMVTLDHLSHGRMTFAIGSGEAKQFAPYGEDRSKPNTRMGEAVRTWYALWNSRGEPVSRESKVWPLRDALFPLPLYADQTPQVLMVGAGDIVFGLAGEVCDGWLTYLPGGLTDDLSPIAQIVDSIKAIARAAGRDPESLRFNAMVNVALGESDEHGWELARSPACGWISIAAAGMSSSQTWNAMGYEHPFGEFTWSRDSNALRVTPDEAAALSEQVPDEITNAVHVWGGPERVAARLQTFINAGINEICFMNLGAAADPAGTTRWNELISEVLVHLGRAPLNLDAEKIAGPAAG
jgi:phthiodiolone/phenolphthiodiolone dimycocerosates ketoreductase